MWEDWVCPMWIHLQDPDDVAIDSRDWALTETLHQPLGAVEVEQTLEKSWLLPRPRAMERLLQRLLRLPDPRWEKTLKSFDLRQETFDF